MGKEPYKEDPTFVAKSRPAWANWLIAAAVIGAATVLLLVTGDQSWTLSLSALVTFACLVGAAVSALMGTKKK